MFMSHETSWADIALPYLAQWGGFFLCLIALFGICTPRKGGPFIK